MHNQLQDNITSILHRLQGLEDRLCVYQLISVFNAAADSSNLSILYDVWNEDCELTYGISETGTEADRQSHKGHAGLKEIVYSDDHQGYIKQGSAHVNSLPHVVIEGDRASATTYQTIFVRVDGRFTVHSVTANRWTFARRDDGWEILTRQTEPMRGTNQRAKDLLNQVRSGA